MLFHVFGSRWRLSVDSSDYNNSDCLSPEEHGKVEETTSRAGQDYYAGGENAPTCY